MKKPWVSKGLLKSINGKNNLYKKYLNLYLLYVHSFSVQGLKKERFIMKEKLNMQKLI